MADLNCNISTCLYYCILVALGVIIGTIILHTLGYIVFSHYYVKTYHSDDLIRQREQQLAMIR